MKLQEKGTSRRFTKEYNERGQDVPLSSVDKRGMRIPPVPRDIRGGGLPENRLLWSID